MKYPAIIIFIISVLIQSCFEEDERAMPYPGEIVTITDSVQRYQSYFDFESESVVETHKLNTWQLGFESSKTGWHIICNSGDGWFLYNTGLRSFDNLPEMPQELIGLYDIPAAWPDSTAVGNWVTFHQNISNYSKNIYLAGKYQSGRYSDMKQIVFHEVSDSQYTFSVKDLSNGRNDTIFIIKDTTVNFVYYSFLLNKQINPEPDKETYDLVFTSYYDMATNFRITMPYLVGGVLINVWKTEAVLDSVNAFEKIGLEHVSGYHFTQQRNIPGYNWKTVTVDVTGGGAATYAIKTHFNYIFKTAQGNYFKMRFISYSLDGKSGHPQFEFRKLE